MTSGYLFGILKVFFMKTYISLIGVYDTFLPSSGKLQVTRLKNPRDNQNPDKNDKCLIL
jgi:hypothetical protein